MRDVWDWHASARSSATRELYGSALSLCMDVSHALRLPGKPGNMTAAARAKYFDKVRHHTQALIHLLSDTRYSSNAATFAGRQIGDAIEEDDLAATVVRNLADWGEDEIGHVVAYYVDEDGVHPLPWNYPESELLDLLWEVIEWTHEDDGWDWNFGLSSSKPLANVKQPSAKMVYFVCTMYETLEYHGMAIPFPQLATLANVALNLSDAEQVDEDVVRKQVRRHHKPRRAPIRDWSF